VQIKDLFQKDIYRNINGVIKVEQDDSENVYQELDEYVVTKEMDKHFHDFFSSYIKTLDYKTDKIGVWVSGFFGSGKSHFIKILSYLLSNKKVNNKHAFEFFQDKFQDEMLLSDIRRAITKGTTDVILFNIDSKSDALNKSDKEGIVKVFMKVFDDMQGYCGEIPWLAELEREMDKRGYYESFKEKYREITGQDWVENRGAFYFDKDNILKALEEVSSMSKETAEKWFDTGESNYTLSIEKFAKIILDYCNSRKDHRIIFLVDEIGQYIGDSTDLMLNLQTLTEDLGRILNGRAWIVVTSQEAIDAITNLKGRDFSKIKGRFSTMLTLSSNNTDAVIKKRILEKKDPVKDYLSLYYNEKKTILRNLISFSSATAEMKSYGSSEEFVEVYPFIPYQFNLVQKVFEQIRKIGASGAHLSEGERSMLSAFQDASKMIGEGETGELVPFSFFYKSIETFLHSGIKRTINQAGENSRLNSEDIELLKILFMIKYIKEIRPNVENLITLSITRIDEDKIILRNSIKESLERLVSETLVKKNFDEYEFLTDEEQDVEREIKSIDIDEQNILEYGANIIFEDIYKDKKYKYSNSNHYSFNSRVDEYNRGSQGHEITVKIMTPWDENYSSSNFNMIMASADGILIKLPQDGTFLDEIKRILQIMKYTGLRASLKKSDTLQKIIDHKNSEVQKIKERVKSLIETAIENSTIYLCGDRVDINGGSAKDIINNALHKMVENVYSKVDYVKKHIVYADDLYEILNANDLDLFRQTQWDSNKLAADDIKGFIERQGERSLKTTVKAIKDKYSKKPYGWSDLDIAGLIASLFTLGDIKVRYQNEYVRDKKAIPDYFTKRDYGEKVLLEPKPGVSIEVIIQVKKIIMDAFGTASLPDDPEGLFNKAKEVITGFHQELKDYRALYSAGRLYPGRPVIEDGIKLLEKILYINDELQFFQALIHNKEDLKDLAEDIEPVRFFFECQVGAFNKALDDYKRFSNDKPYLTEEAKRNLEEMDRIFSLKEPYNDIKDLPLLTAGITEQHSKVLEDYRKNIIDKIQVVLQDIRDILERNKSFLKPAFSESIISYYTRQIAEVEHVKDCVKFKALNAEIEEWKSVSLKQIDEEIGKYKGEQSGATGKPVKKVEQIKTGDFPKRKGLIETEGDLEEYIDNLKEKLKKILQEDKVIRFI